MAKALEVDGAPGWRVGAAWVVLLALLALITEGYDLQVMSFAAPSLIRAWHAPRAAFGAVFSASLVGILFGAPLFGWIGDRVGRKWGMAISSALYGLLSLACLAVRDVQALEALRLLIGVGLGGVMPNAIAAAAEASPPRHRPMVVTVIAIGISIGGLLPGLVATRAGGPDLWRSLFWIGGLLPLALALLVAVGMPRSAAVRGETRAEDGAGSLFAGDLKWITPALWVMSASLLMSLFLLTSWLPLLLESGGFSPPRAAAIATAFQVGGLAGCVCTSLVLGRLGGGLIVALFVMTLAAVAVVARAPLPDALLGVAIGACGFCIIGGQGVLNGVAGLVYPRPVRARGVGLSLGVARIGSIVGPLAAGVLVAAGITAPRDLFLLPLLPLALGLAAAVIVARRIGRLDGASVPGKGGGI
jgi:AAHS family 4-hydroxybenzoate transporter-like MFS transporter